MRSVYDDHHHRLSYEAGPWRVPNGHVRTKRLFAQLGVRLEPMETSPIDTHGDDATSNAMPGLSTWDVHALHTLDPLSADRADLATGYADQTASASGSSPYTTGSRRFFVAPEGFRTMIERLAEGSAIEYDCRVVGVSKTADGAYRVRCVVRTGHNSFQPREWVSRYLFVCVPPDSCREWSIFALHARSLMASVVSGQLHHIYIKGDEATPRGQHTTAQPLLAQTVSSQYSWSHWFQASYSGGRIARFWNHLKLSYPDRFEALLRRLTGQAWVGTWSSIVTPEIRSHFWPVAYHAWVPVPNFDLSRAVRLSVRPNPMQLPGVFFAGEAFSSHQAWMEGALETADLAFYAFVDPTEDEFRPPGPYSVVLDGVTLDVEEWMDRHPGGRKALENHLGEDVTLLFKHIGHSSHAWAIVHSLKA